MKEATRFSLRAIRRAALQAGGIALVTLLMFAVVEGLSSFVLLAYEASKDIPDRRPHTRYDSELGWVAIPNVHMPDLYGKGVYFRTNAQGFRNNYDFQVTPPAGKLRMICSGDSFTLGFSVDNDHPWCQELANRNSRFETVNMGQTGYGIDQAYLWFLRDGLKLKHDVHIFAFIARDLLRMASPYFMGYGKPVLKLEKGSLVVKNTPVPEVTWKRRLSQVNSNLNSMQLLRRASARLQPPPPIEGGTAEAQIREVALKVFEELQDLHAKQNRVLVLVYLPWADDYLPDEINDERRDFLRRETSRRGLLYYDLTEEFRQLDQRDAESLFVREKAPWPHIGVWGHYNNDGNRFVADALYGKLIHQQEIVQKLQRLSAEGHFAHQGVKNRLTASASPSNSLSSVR